MVSANNTLEDEAIRPFAEGRLLSEMLVSLLERRYLSNLQADNWSIQVPSTDQGVPILRELKGVGRFDREEEFAQASTHMLTSCHQAGHALICLQYGKDGHQRLFWGARRLIGQASGSTLDYVLGLASNLQATDRDLELAPPVRLDDSSLKELNTFLQTAPAQQALTGIASLRNGRLNLHQRGNDRIAHAMGTGQAVVMTVAEPVDSNLIDQTIDICLSLKTEIHSFVRVGKQTGKSNSRKVSISEQQVTNQSLFEQMPELLGHTTRFFQVLTTIAPTPQMAVLAGFLNGATMLAREQATRRPPLNRETEVAKDESTTASDSRDLLNAHAEACEQLIDKYIQRLRRTRNNGCWNVLTYITADSEGLLRQISNSIQSNAGGDETYLDPLRDIRLPSFLLRQTILSGRVLRLKPKVESLKHPLGTLYETLGTCLNSEELSVLMHLPPNPLAGLPLRTSLRFALSAPAVSTPRLYIGKVHNGLSIPLYDLHIPLQSLNTHAFVGGKSGSGKTNTCMQILTEAYQHYQIPFMVIEPAKEEYRGLMQFDPLKEHLRIFAVGNPNAPSLRLNPFEPVPGISIARHIDLLKGVFNASFPMYAGMSYVLEDAIYEIYQDKGWSLTNSTNRYLHEPITGETQAPLMPTLTDLYFKIDVVLQRKNYGREIHQNLGAALRSRIQSLLVGTKGMVFNTRRSIPFQELMEKPCIIEMQHLGNDEDKSFLVALLYVMIYEYAESRQRFLPPSRKEQLQHILLIEEAHKLLTAKAQSTSEEVGDPKGKAVAMFTDMLAELRSYGEGIIVADQTPTKLAREVIKNTNLKIIHRLSDPDERQTAGRSINLNNSQIDSLAVLPDGFAIVQDKHFADGLLVKIHPFKTKHLHTLLRHQEEFYLQSAVPKDKTYLHRHAGCRSCQAVCLAYREVEDSNGIRDFETIEGVLFKVMRKGEYDQCFIESWLPWVEQQKKVLPSLSSDQQCHFLFCLAINQAEAFLVNRIIRKAENLKSEQNREDTSSGLPPMLHIQPPISAPLRMNIEDILALLGNVFESWIFEKDDYERRKAFRNAQNNLPKL